MRVGQQKASVRFRYHNGSSVRHGRGSLLSYDPSLAMICSSGEYHLVIAIDLISAVCELLGDGQTASSAIEL